MSPYALIPGQRIRYRVRDRVHSAHHYNDDGSVREGVIVEPSAWARRRNYVCVLWDHMQEVEPCFRQSLEPF